MSFTGVKREFYEEGEELFSEVFVCNGKKEGIYKEYHHT